MDKSQHHRTGAKVEFVSNRWMAQVTTGLLVANVGLAAVGIPSSFVQLDIVTRAAVGDFSASAAAASDARQAMIGILQTVALIGSGVFFLLWFRIAHRNLSALGEQELKYSPGWAVGGFFVPFLNLVRPMQVMREVWHGSNPDPDEPASPLEWPQHRNALGTPDHVRLWWGSYVVMTILGQIALRMASSLAREPAPTVEALQAITLTELFEDGVTVASGIITLLLVKRITDWQETKLARATAGRTATA